MVFVLYVTILLFVNVMVFGLISLSSRHSRSFPFLLCSSVSDCLRKFFLVCLFVFLLSFFVHFGFGVFLG